MPKRSKHQTRPTEPKRPGDARRRSFAEKIVDSPYWPAMFAVIDAEARGDVTSALAVIHKTGNELDGERFWHPQRIERLRQLGLLAALLPRWAQSRWLVSQAIQGTHPRNRWRMAKAMKVAMDIRGGPDPERDREDDRIRIMDRDWVYRQVFLYEAGGLDAFLRHNAAADLVAGADRIWEWTQAPMRGLRLLAKEPRELLWEDPATGEQLTTINIGAGMLVDDGECVIGRVVPITEGLMFETVPLRVPDEVAYAAADEPERWIEALRDVCVRPEEERGWIWVERGLRDYGLLTDVPYDLVTLAMDAGLHAFRHPDDDEPGDLFKHPADYVTCLAAWLLRPETIAAFGAGLPPEARAVLIRFVDLVPEPAAGLIRDLSQRPRQIA